MKSFSIFLVLSFRVGLCLGSRQNGQIFLAELSLTPCSLLSLPVLQMLEYLLRIPDLSLCKGCCQTLEANEVLMPFDRVVLLRKHSVEADDLEIGSKSDPSGFPIAKNDPLVVLGIVEVLAISKSNIRELDMTFNKNSYSFWHKLLLHLIPKLFWVVVPIEEIFDTIEHS
ncbi:hypothetical protein BDZ45DRAFT_151713 [Acephala macrosclerotiorum]|nr:hypothetical protein BDZ45DRAFT_151713 [Acephala macrosclerotiorum]